MALVDLKTKRCVFCAETIQAEAIKCRFCGEFLNTPRARALERSAKSDADSDEGGQADERILFAGRPSLWALASDVLRGAVFGAVGGVLVAVPVEKLAPLGLAPAQAELFGRYRLLLGVGVIATVFFILAIKLLRLKMTYYEVTPERIEWSRGIFDRRIDNIDMFRVVDLKLRRSVLDCLLGVGTVELVTTDKTDPTFRFEKVSDSRVLYDAIKRASLEADRATGVVHLE